MRILIFNWRDLKHSWAGGGEIYIFEQATRWAKMGHSVTVFCGEDPETKLLFFEETNGIKIYRRGGRFSLYFWAVWYYITKFRGTADIVIDVENGIPFFTPLFIKVPIVSLVYHIHGNQFLYEFPLLIAYFGRFIERHLFPFLYRNTTIIVISQTTKEILVRYGIPVKNINIVYCGINGTYSRLIKHVKKFTHPTILYLGRIKRYKRVDLLVHIFPKVLAKVPNARLIIAGWGTEASNVADLVMKSPLRRKMTLAGPVSNTEKRRLLSNSWLFVNPSIGEGWSIAVIEANIHGTPAISFRVPGLSESIQHRKTGLLSIDTNDLIHNICTVLTQPKVRDNLSMQAKKWAEQFNWDKTSLESLKLFSKVIKDSRNKSPRIL